MHSDGESNKITTNRKGGKVNGSTAEDRRQLENEDWGGVKEGRKEEKKVTYQMNGITTVAFHTMTHAQETSGRGEKLTNIALSF